MHNWMHTLRVGLTVPTMWVATGEAMADDPYITGGAVRGMYRPYTSPPGWFGPGPNTHRYTGPGPGTGWGYSGLGGGPYVGYPSQMYGGMGYPYWWNYRGAVGSFWTNGLSLYGPPVPTYGPVPGAFSGSNADKFFFRNPPPANAVWVGLGWNGYRSPSPRPAHPSVNVYPTIPPGSMVPTFVSSIPPATDPTCIRIAVKVPQPGAIVWVDKKETKLTGTERMFESPSLKAGEKYKYDLIAQWTENGQSRAESRTVTATAGETVVIDFSKERE